MPVTLWGLLVVLKAVVTGLCFGIGFYLKDALIVYIRERKQEIESNLETRQPWHHNAQKQINKEWRSQYLHPVLFGTKLVPAESVASSLE